MYVRKVQIVCLITAWFISEHRKFCDWKTSAQSKSENGFQKDNATFTGSQKPFLFISFLMIQACAIGLRGISTVL